MSDSNRSFEKNVLMDDVTESIRSSQLPKAVEEFTFKAILDRKKDKLKQIIPNIANQLVDSDPAIALLEESSYTEGILRNKLNKGLLAVTVQYACGSDLDNLGRFYGIERKLIEREDNSSIPPKKAVWESDEELRRRILEAPKGFSVAGPRNSYIYYGKLADNKVKDISASSPSPGVVNITVLSYEGNGTATPELIEKVSKKLNDEDIRPLGDKVNIASAEIVNFEVKVEVEVANTPNIPLILQRVKSNIQEFVKKHHRLVGVLRISGLCAVCHNVEGIEGVILKSPTADILTKNNQAPYCTNIEVTIFQENMKEKEDNNQEIIEKSSKRVIKAKQGKK